MMPPAGAEGAASPLTGLLPFILIIPLFYFLLIRPQKKQQQTVKNMQNSLKKNDPVVTAGGLHGLIVNVKDDTVIIKVSDNVKVEVNKTSISYVNSDKTKNEGKTDSTIPVN